MASIPGDAAWSTPGWEAQDRQYAAPGDPTIPSALPVDLSIVTVVGTYLDATTHRPLAGSIRFQPTVPQVIDIASGTVVTLYSTAVPLDRNGQFSVTLLSTNDPDQTPEFLYQVHEAVPGGRKYGISVPWDSVSPISISNLPQNTAVEAPSVIMYMRGEQGLIGPQGPPGTGSVIFTQASPSASWLINHSFGRKPSVTVYDSAGEQIDADITVTDTQVTVFWPSAVTGSAILN